MSYRKHDNDLLAQERAAIISWALSHGEQLSTAEVAEKLGVGYPGAFKIMEKLARVLPITQDEMGNWYSIEHYKTG